MPIAGDGKLYEVKPGFYFCIYVSNELISALAREFLSILKHFPLFCPKCKENFIINVKDHIVDYQSIARR